MVYSQNNEQDVILDYFKDFKGKFLDIGANDGLTFSNSRALAEIGWQGTLIEPSPEPFKRLKALYNKTKCKVLNIAIGDSSGEITFYDCVDTLLSSTNLELVKSWNRPYEEIKVKVKTFNEAVPVNDFDFITIDAESMDLIILRQIDLTNVKCLCIEHGNTIEAEILEYCTGFKTILRNYENLILIK